METSYKSKIKDNKFYKNLLSGGISAVIAKTAAAPLGTLRNIIENFYKNQILIYCSKV